MAGAVAPAYLVSGRSGVGRDRFVREAASLLLCEGGRKAAPCGACRACKDLVAGTHPDCLWILPPPGKRWIPVSSVRRTEHEPEEDRRAYPVRLEDFLALASVRGGARVVAVDPAEGLTEAAANALLKNLEEPPRGVVFLLVVEREGALLPTIRSRAQVVRLRPMDAAALSRRLAAELGVPRARAAILAGLSGGAPAAAERLSRPEEWADVSAAARLLARAMEGPPLAAAAGMLSWVEEGSKGNLEGARERLRLAIDLLLHAMEPGSALSAAEETAPLAAAVGGRGGSADLREAALAAHRALGANVHLPLVVAPLCLALSGRRSGGSGPRGC